MRVLSSGNHNNSGGKSDPVSFSFVACDRGLLYRDVCIPSIYERNRSIDGDIVFIELIQPVITNSITTTTTPNDDKVPTNTITSTNYKPKQKMTGMNNNNNNNNNNNKKNTFVAVSDDDDDKNDEQQKNNENKKKNNKSKNGNNRKKDYVPTTDKINKNTDQHDGDDDDDDEEEEAGDVILFHNNIITSNTKSTTTTTIKSLKQEMNQEEINMVNNNNDDDDDNNIDYWQDDEMQMNLWNPLVSIKKKKKMKSSDVVKIDSKEQQQWHGRVVYIVPSNTTNIASEIHQSKNDFDNNNNNDNATNTIKPAERTKKNNDIQTNNNYNYNHPRRIIVGTLQKIGSTTYLLNPNNKALPQFKVMPSPSEQQINELIEQANNEIIKQRQKKIIKRQQHQQKKNEEQNDDNLFEEVVEGKEQADDDDDDAPPTTSLNQVMVQAVYEYGSWKETYTWPPCCQIQYIGRSCILENEINALLVQYNVNHGDQHPPAALQDCQEVVQSGLFQVDSVINNANCTANGGGDGDRLYNWKPTPEMMYVESSDGRHRQLRRDYRDYRIFTIDPTTAKDLDDAVHIHRISDTVVEIGVHIADVSYFVDPSKTPNLDKEAMHRATTVYLVDRTIPMLPRPLCEIACSLNENVERLAFSCVWRMNVDGTMQVKKKKTKSRNSNTKEVINDDIKGKEIADVWYGRTIIKSCARLDYLTAQNIIDGKVCNPGACGLSLVEQEMLWPKSRRPVPGCIHTMDQIASDVRLLHMVAMARRQLRFMNGALELNSTKLTFQLDPVDRQTPLLAAPYPIRDSNRLIEEYMLLANYLVAQRLIQYCHDRACLRHHPAPLSSGLGQVKELVKTAIPDFDFDLDVTSSQTLQHSLWTLSQRCHALRNSNESDAATKASLMQQCITQLLMTPMQPAEYIAAGVVPKEDWQHFALNIPYYTHFTSPIRRYPDIIVHRLLQESIDAEINSTNNHPYEVIQNTPNTRIDENNWDVEKIDKVCAHCNERRMESKHAQERCDRIFLALYVRDQPMKSQLGIVLSVGVTTFTVFVPKLGVEGKLFLLEHKDDLVYHSSCTQDTSSTSPAVDSSSPNHAGHTRTIVLTRKKPFSPPSNNNGSKSDSERHEDDKNAECRNNNNQFRSFKEWDTLEIQVFTKISVTVICKDSPPIDVKLLLEGPWDDGAV